MMGPTGDTHRGSVAGELSELDADGGTGCRSDSPALSLLKERRRLVDSWIWKQPTKRFRDSFSRTVMFLSIVDNVSLERVTSAFITPEEIGDSMPFDDFGPYVQKL
jgi:hypothetical protein